jgi:hypothetical protein
MLVVRGWSVLRPANHGDSHRDFSRTHRASAHDGRDVRYRSKFRRHWCRGSATESDPKLLFDQASSCKTEHYHLVFVAQAIRI